MNETNRGLLFLLAFSLLANAAFALWMASAAVREQAAFRRGQADQVARLHDQAKLIRMQVRLRDADILGSSGGSGRRWSLSPERGRLLADASALDRAATLLEAREAQAGD